MAYSRHSCHWEGNPYLQAGDHHFSFSVTSHGPGWINSVNFGRQANEALRGVWADRQYAIAGLPEKMSFFSTGNPYVLISTVKKAEDGEGIVFRLADMEGTDKIVPISLFSKRSKAFSTTLTEEIMEPLPCTNNQPMVKLGHHAIETLMVE